jgi:Ser/Thr protein kinase RdoA (MazF antagonist)
VFQVQREFAPDWILRIYPTTSPTSNRDQALALADILAFLEYQQYPAERIVRTTEGMLTFRSDHWHILITTYLGLPIQKWQPASSATTQVDTSTKPDLQLLYQIGALLAKLHSLDLRTMNGELFNRLGLQPASELAAASEWLAQIQGNLPAHLQEEYTCLKARIEQVPCFDKCQQTIIHGDCHLGNVIVTPTNDHVFVDWEAAGQGAAVTDLGLLLSSCVDSLDDQLNRAAINAIIDGYCTCRTMSQIERDLLPDAIRFRILVTLAGAFEERMSPDYQPTQHFWGRTYGEWEQLEQQSLWIANIVQERLEMASRVHLDPT